jgi:predicted transcriptional regulator of viral defense system
MNEIQPDYQRRALGVLVASGRPLSLKDLERFGVNRMTANQLLSSGLVERPVRGVYHAPSAYDDQRVFWAALSLGFDVVFSLMSAASFHGLTEESVGRPTVALPIKARIPSSESTEIPVDYIRWNERDRERFVDEHEIQGVSVRVTSPARTIVDLFRFSELNTKNTSGALVSDSSFFEALGRFMSKGDVNRSSSHLRDVAMEFGCWKDISAFTASFSVAKQMTSPH